MGIVEPAGKLSHPPYLKKEEGKNYNTAPHHVGHYKYPFRYVNDTLPHTVSC